ncbi:hypothetical protein DCC62_22960 [candidate division KSB1 bacterium]|nr:MAG: hypothetical protein DCC62_22960 [candidate division KSB1 bacterium]
MSRNQKDDHRTITKDFEATDEHGFSRIFCYHFFEKNLNKNVASFLSKIISLTSVFHPCASVAKKLC